MSALRLARGFTGRDRDRQVRGLLSRPRPTRCWSRRASGARRSACPTPPGVPEAVADAHARRCALQRPRRGWRSSSRSRRRDRRRHRRAGRRQHGLRPAARRASCEGLRAALRRARRAADLRRGDDRLPRRAAAARRSATASSPDLTTLGKIIGGGMPVGAYGGRGRSWRRVAPLGPVYQAGTLSGNPLAMAAGLATLERCSARPASTKRLAHEEDALHRGASRPRARAASRSRTNHVGGMFGLFFTSEASVRATRRRPATQPLQPLLPRDAGRRHLPGAVRVRGRLRLDRARRRRDRRHRRGGRPCLPPRARLTGATAP